MTRTNLLDQHLMNLLGRKYNLTTLSLTFRNKTTQATLDTATITLTAETEI